MLRFVSILLICILPAYAIAQEKDWQKELAQDLVFVKDGKMAFDEVGICKMGFEGYEPASVQVKVHSEAPDSAGISRDNFVAYSSTLSWMILTTAFAEAYQIPASTFLQGFEFEELETLIGKPDLELNFYMTNQGTQIEVINTATGDVNRITQLWKDQ